MQNVYRQYLRQQWSDFVTDTNERGFRFTDGAVESMDRPITTPEAKRAYTSGDIYAAPDKVAVPIRLRNEILGMIDLRVYVTDDKGIVLFDSTGKDEGRDYSRWNDVYRTLRGRDVRVTGLDPTAPAISTG